MNENEAISLWTEEDYSKCSTSELEDHALKYYLRDGFESLNQHLLNTSIALRYSSALREALTISAEILSRKLKKLPSYQVDKVEINVGEETILSYLNCPISRQNLPEQVIDEITTTFQLQSPCFVSANLGWEVKQHRPHRLIIHSLNGKHVADYSENADTENEILFDKNTLFYVQEIEERDNSEIWIYLMEAEL